MNKQDLTAMVAEILTQMGTDAPAVKSSPYHAAEPGPEPEVSDAAPGDFVPDITALDLRKLYLTDSPADAPAFARMKAKTPARLGSGKAGARYKTLTMLRFRADHAAAQDAVFSQVPEDYAQSHDLIPLQSRCQNKDEYLTRPDLGRLLDESSEARLRAAVPHPPTVQLVIGDGLSSAAIMANAMDCLQAIREGLKLRHIDTGPALFVRYCRVGAGDAVGDITGCKLVCVLVGERPGLVTDKSISVYLTYQPHTGVSESSRTVVSNIHAQGTPAVEAGAYTAELIEKILQKQVSGVGLHLEQAL